MDDAPACGFAFAGEVCKEHGEHLCVHRASHVVGFFRDCLTHTKGRYARQPFTLADWQVDEIFVPLFGTVRWDATLNRYARRYRIAYLSCGRKNGKALDVDTPILAERGWTTMGELRAGDRVHAVDGSLTNVGWVSDRHIRPSYRVRFADGAELVAADDHKWAVNDRRLARVVTTVELAETLHCGARGDRRYTVDVPEPLDRPDVDLPVDPYVLGVWLGDGTSRRGEVTSADPTVLDAVAAAGYPPSYRYQQGAAVTQGFRGLAKDLRRLGVLGNKHAPGVYLTASHVQRLALLRGLMDTDGSVVVGPNTPRVEFTSTTRGLARAVLTLARSLGWKATVSESRAQLDGRDCGPRWRVTWTAWADRSPFTVDRKTRLLAPSSGRTRSHSNAVVSVEPVGDREVVCISVDHPSHMFLAGEAFTPTHNSEILAGIALYLLCADGEEGAEVYGAAGDRDQARKVFDVAMRMVQLSPVLSRRLIVKAHAKRIVDERTGSFYEIVPADAAGNLGHNPNGVVFDEFLAQKDGRLYSAMRTAMGTRDQPLLVIVTTASDDPEGFPAQQHAEFRRMAEDDERAPHVFVWIRELPSDADPWDEGNWPLANPALGSFLSLQALRDEAVEAFHDPSKENAFRQYRCNQMVQQATRWMPLHTYDECMGEPWPDPAWRYPEFRNRVAYAGLDLAARLDLCAWAVLVPDDVAHVLWRFWLPEAALPDLDLATGGQASMWARDGWLTVTEGDVLDYDVVYAAIAADGEHFTIREIDYDPWSGEPVVQELGKRLGKRVQFVSIPQTYTGLSPGMTELMALTKAKRWAHHGNPVARFCFDAVEVRHPRDEPDLVRPVKPRRDAVGKRIDAVVVASMAVGAWKRGEQTPRSRGVAGF